MQNPRDPESGQSLVECLLCLGILVALGAGFAWFLSEQWQRMHCRHQLFGATHARMMPGVSGRSRFRQEASVGHVHMVDDGRILQGQMRCGNQIESLSLPHLESAQWSPW